MMRFRSPLFTCALVLATSVTCLGTAVEAAAERLPRVPQVLRLGFPSSTGRADLERSLLFDTAVERLTEVSSGLLIGRGAGAVEFDLAVGSDYQVLQWLEDGSLDAGLASPFMLHLFMTHPVGGRRATTFVALADPRAPGQPLVLPATGGRAAVRSTKVHEGRWRDRASPLEDYESFLNALLRESLGSEESGEEIRLAFCLAFPSHLSTSGFIAPLVHAQRWLEEQGASKAPASTGSARLSLDQERRFWKSFLHHGRFSLILDAEGLPAQPGCSRTDSIEIAFSPDGRDTGPSEGSPGWQALPWVEVPGWDPPGFALLIDRQAAHRLRLGTVEVTDVWPESTAIINRLLDDPVLAKILAPQYRKAALFTGRHYRYSIDEIVTLLKRDQIDSGFASLSLILPGGGVKAAYQALLLDHLYGNEELRNHPHGPEADLPEPGSPLDVSYVIGNSGGALLGFFVSQLNEGDPRKLHRKLLTNKHKKTLTSGDIFGYLDIMRWVTVLAHYALFALLFIIAVFPSRSPFRKAPPAAFSKMRVALMGPLYLLALAAPYWIQPHTEPEHVPWVWGIFYFGFLCLIFYAESAYTVDRQSKPPVRSRQALSWYGLALLSAFAAWALSSHGTSRIYSVLLGTALFLSATAIILGARSRSHRYSRLSTGATFLSGIGLPLLTLAFCYLIFSIFVATGAASMLELTTTFWVRFLAISFFLSALVITLGFLGTGQEGRLGFIHRGLHFLAERHPSGRLVSLRLLRVLFFFAAGLAWWNLIVAPALYGNEYTREYLDGVIDRFQEAAPDRAPSERDLPGPPETATGLRTFYVAPANSLEKNAERYFISPPEGISQWDLPVEITGDERWTVVRDKTLLRKIIFASGSPFPVFPPHRIAVPRQASGHRIPTGEIEFEQEDLVDGGYAHNVPVEAAKQVGARQALVVYSENPAIEAGSGLLALVKPGPLATNLPRLMPFMFERSQTLDNLSKKSLFVAALAPSWTKPGWPKLFDFRRSVVEWMLREANGDLEERIGTVESWGRPRFIYKIREGYYLRRSFVAQSSSLD